MTKLKYILLLLAIALLPQVLKAERVKIGDLYYELNDQDGTAEVTYQNDRSDNYEGLKNVIIPNVIESNSKSYKITSIGHGVFWRCSSLTSIVLPNSVTSIGGGAFSQCSSLENIKIPNSVTSIGRGAFHSCSSLKSIVIPNSVTSIGEEAFRNCSSLKSINISSDNNVFCSIDGVLYSKDKTTLIRCPEGKKGKLEIPNSVKSIGRSAFEGCSGLTSVTIPNSVSSIEGNAFDGCSGLTSFTIPNSVTSIGRFAFFSCSGLTSFTIPNSVTSIVNCTFSGCKGLTSVSIPNSVTSIGEGAFGGCSGLTSVTIPNSVTSIGRFAFSSCSGLTSITIPNSVTSIGDGAFKNCDNLKEISIPEDIDVRNLALNSSVRIIRTPPLSAWEKLNKSMLSWDQFYKKNRKAKLTYENVSQIEAYINQEIEKWQVKDEFESTNEWKARVNESTRQQKVRELSAPLIEQHNLEVAHINEEQIRLAREYEKYKQDLIDGYYRTLIGQATNSFSTNDFNLNPYDADNGTFLIRSSKYGDILLPVPGRDEARSFKDNWESIKKDIKPEFVPNGEDVALTKLIFTNNAKQYVYDSHTEANYAVTDVKYNFKPVELADISLDDINTNLPALANADVSSQIISKTSNEAITPQKVQPSKNTVVASDRSDVDYAIPSASQDVSSNTFAVIIANEDYSSNARVPYASNDGEIMAKYLTSAVGLPENHVKIYRNATYGKVAEAVNYIEKLGEAYGDKMNLIFYYAGHGIPDEKTKTALLLPVDGNPSISKTCYSVDELVKNLGNLKANNVILMIDACFSGATRNDDMLVAASGNRGVRLRSNDISPIGNMVVLSATQGDETAYPYDREQHGLFTYFLLKKLQENKGNVTLGELADYVIENVKQTSIVNNGKLQTPTVTVSPSLVGSWRDIPLK